MNVNDKKSLALLISYVDKLVEEQFTNRLDAIESLIESSPLVLKEDGELFFIEGPQGKEGERGPRGFRGPDGERGPAGKDADPKEVAKYLRVDEEFVRSVQGPAGPAGRDADPSDVIEQLLSDQSFLESVRGPQGKEGPAGKDADVKKIVESLKRSKLFKEEIRGPKGRDGKEGPAGPQGAPGVGLHSLSLVDKSLVVEKTDGTVDKILLPLTEQFDSSIITRELETLKKELNRIRSDVTAQITRSIMSSGGSSSGGGEVRIEFMDDFVRSSLIGGDGKSIVWNEDLRKFELGSLNDNEGVITFKSKVNPFLDNSETIATVPKGIKPLLLNELYSMYVVDPIDNRVLSVPLYTPDGYIQFDSNDSMMENILYLNYRQATYQNWPFLKKINVDPYLQNGGLRAVIPFADFSINNIETIRLVENNREVEAIIKLFSDRIVIESNVSLAGHVIETMVNYLPSYGNRYFTIPLSGTTLTVDFATYAIKNVISHMIVNDTTKEIEDVAVYLTDNWMRFDSSVNMIGRTLKIWYTPI